MAKYLLSESAKEDLIRIHQYGTKKFGVKQADKYFNDFFDCFDSIAKNPFAFESVDYIRKGYRRCVFGVDSVFFRLENEVVQIIVIVGRQDLDELKNSW
ncbi:type II toxin-antitoxin system RelE/ParE family toxin [Crocinitomix algicola]|uniref:type II toxin-antitoxin system RelE/ParE family toxin n=1 Tax=Crocinitomix algicola TaxID=1740263 RepID=UPI000873437F|nr:type II toxin-antitoxin system RelE/ParE family toxin [Crocinitomix algicola]